MKQIQLSQKLPYDVKKPLVDLAAVLGVQLVTELTEKVVGELYLTAVAADKARLSCQAIFLSADGRRVRAEESLVFNTTRGEWSRCAKLAMVRVLEEAWNQRELPWGILTGVRPGKLAYKLLEAGFKVKEVLQERYLLPLATATQIEQISLLQQKVVPVVEKEIAVYIGVPYCPSRCLYCSFPAGIMPQTEEFQQNFCQLIEEDVLAVVQLLNMHELKIVSIYVGGGTPTSLQDKFFRQLMEIIKQHLCTEALREFTVEAGRPDCFTADKLAAMEMVGVNRISINPQTMHDKTLQLIGRKHSVQDVYTAYEAVRNSKIPIINMDLIVGLPEETLADFAFSLERVLELTPDNLTVHTLSLKKGAPLFAQRQKFEFLSASEAATALQLAAELAGAQGLRPYYLYRQHYMLGHLANIGYALPQTESLYNIQMMEERHTVLGIGPSSATKVPAVDGHHLYKYHMPKDLYTYQATQQELFAKRAATLACRYEEGEVNC
ncbi:MAG: coproporphyrinogen dehydrogenase HemZ [Acidaminococcaceae bacterium]